MVRQPVFELHGRRRLPAHGPERQPRSVRSRRQEFKFEPIITRRQLDSVGVGEGRSPKSGESLGRRGIGKQVFPTASRLHAMLGLTIRDDSPSRVFMGSAVVRNHSASGQEFQGDAWFGCRDVPEKSVSPVTDAEFIEKFGNPLGLKRGTSRGLSVVVPSVDERVDVADLLRGIVRSFFWPILLGELAVDLESPGENWHIEAETLAAQRTLLPPNEAAVVEFSAWASTAKPSETVSLQSEAGNQARLEGHD